MADPGKAIFFLRVIHLVVIHLAAQPFSAVEADLDLKGKPALEPQVHEAELPMQMIEIEMLTLAALEFELQLFGLAIAAQKISAAGFHAAEDPD